jgi:hypothetical protein
MGIEPDSKLAEYARLLAGWPGLIARGQDPAALVEDSLSLLPHLEGVERLVDVGSGGGMPGLPLKLARPRLQVTLIESDRRKAAFLEQAAARLGLEVEVRAERAEDAGRGPLRESFDAASIRPPTRTSGRQSSAATGRAASARLQAASKLSRSGPRPASSARSARTSTSSPRRAAARPPSWSRRPCGGRTRSA